MGRTLRRLVTRVVLVVVAALAAYAGWKWGYAVFPRVEEGLGIGQAGTAALPITPETAARATARIREFRSSEEPELRLESSEVSSLLRYSTPAMLPGGVVQPSVSFSRERIEFQAKALPRNLPDLPRVGGILGLLPDTVDILVIGSLLPSREEGTLLLIEGIELEGWPVPPNSVPEILAALGRESPPGVPESTVLVPALGGLRGAYTEDGRLVLVRAGRGAVVGPGMGARMRRGGSPRGVKRVTPAGAGMRWRES